MTSARPSRISLPWAAVLSCLAFFLMGMAFIPRLGIEVDEALVVSGIYDRAAPWFSWRVFGWKIPIMLITYLGANKVWFYALWFKLWPVSEVSLRLPMLVAGCVTIWLFYRLLERVAGRRAAWIGCLLLATDASYLLLNAIDFGFVTFQHLFKLAGILLILRFHQKRSRRDLAWGFLLFGLGMWDKAVFAWVLAGLAAAVLVVFPRELREHLNLRNAGTAAVFFCLGALPLIAYNIARPLETFRSNAVVTREPLNVKVHLLRQTLKGAALFGFYVADNPGPRPGAPATAMERASLELSRAAGAPRANLMEPALVASLVMIPLLWRTPARRPLLFSFVYMGVAWVQMALTQHAGGAAHHAILLWPFPCLVIAVAIAEAALHAGRPGAWIAISLVAVLAGSNLLVVNQYFADLVRNGPGPRWTDAINPLTERLGQLRAKHIFVVDWGILESVNLLSRGSVPVEFATDLPKGDALAQMLGDADHAFVSHTSRYEILPGVNRKLDDCARDAGLEKELLNIIYDQNGRGVFEIFRFHRAA